MEFVNGMTSHIIENNPAMCQKPPTRFGIPLLTSEKFHCDYHGNHQPVKNSTVTKPWKFHPPRFPPASSVHRTWLPGLERKVVHGHRVKRPKHQGPGTVPEIRCPVVAWFFTNKNMGKSIKNGGLMWFNMV